MRSKASNYTAKEIREAYLFLAPLLLALLFFIFLPVLGALGGSFLSDIGPVSGTRLVWFDNYKRLFAHEHFWLSVRFTVLFAVVSVTLETVLGLAFALVLNEKIPFRGWLRAIVLIPWAIPMIISARTWQLIYNYGYGVANFLLLKWGIVQDPVNWLGTSTGAFFSIVIADAWKTTPFMTIILLAGLQAIPRDLYKQAMVDGTTFFQRFRRITLPLLKPVLLVALIFRTIDALRIFDLVYVLTGGAPGGTTASLSLYGYKFFTGDFGRYCSVSVAVFLLVFLSSILYIKLGRFQEGLTR